ncbi:TPR repeat protein [Ignavibacterium album JCM 16511]|uniref:TPR repeat protein n=1 Tax=Ignavibacterium album (strain DSM 19864 / JCM 16511 / NBRC 101810 / Mat9-16) TaxID=945713 RepID=I0AP59_IGNAJ|nr:tetratricopeptide repeat protein [Ignavibacterium album]AFH50766.1 TPR repeat protein [Ignavibacterium album JCM 16511]
MLKKLLTFFLFINFISCSIFNQQYYENAYKEYSDGNYQTALYYLDEIIKENENVYEVFVLRSKVNLKLGNTEQAEKDIQRALELHEGYDAHFIMGKILFDKSDFSNALYHFSQSVKLNPKFTDGFLNRAYTYYKLNDFEKSIEDYEKVHELDPNSSVVFVNIGFIYGLTGRNDLAIEYYSKAITLNPNDFNAYYNRAGEYLTQRKNKEALTDLLSAYELDNKNTDLLFLIAETRTKLNDYQNAFNDYTKIILIDSLNSLAYYQRGLINIELKREKAACDDFKKAGELGYFEAYEQIKKHCSKKPPMKKKK